MYKEKEKSGYYGLNYCFCRNWFLCVAIQKMLRKSSVLNPTRYFSTVNLFIFQEKVYEYLCKILYDNLQMKVL